MIRRPKIQGNKQILAAVITNKQKLNKMHIFIEKKY